MSDLKFDQILDEYVRFCNDSGKIDLNLYEEYNVKRDFETPTDEAY